MMDRPRTQWVDRRLEEGTLLARSVELPIRAPRSVLKTLAKPRIMWAGPGEPTTIGSGRSMMVTTERSHRFKTLQRDLDALFAGADIEIDNPVARPRVIGGVSFHDRKTLNGPWSNFPAGGFVLPTILVTIGPDTMWVTVSEFDSDVDETTVENRLDVIANDLMELSPPVTSPSGPGIRASDHRTSADQWREQIDGVLERIRTGELQKLVLAQSLEVSLDQSINLSDVIDRLAVSYPDCHRFLWETPAGSAFFGATPERLVSKLGRYVETSALAGSTGRGDTDTEDRWLADELTNNHKDLQEHGFVRDTILEQLKPYTTAIRTEERQIRRLATVQHLETPITGTLADDPHILELVDVLHPTPAVGGVPPDTAMAVIATTEPFDRGWYAAPFGWCDAAGDGNFAVGIRSAVADERTATLYAGAGIVEESHPAREWDEVQLKYRPILDALE